MMSEVRQVFALVCLTGVIAMISSRYWEGMFIFLTGLALGEALVLGCWMETQRKCAKEEE